MTDLRLETERLVLRGRGLMERLGMRYCEGMDFDHPAVAPDSALLPHVTYRLDLPA